MLSPNVQTQGEVNTTTLELINNYKSGDRYSGELLFEKYEKLIRKILNFYLKNYGLKPLSLDDLDNPNWDYYQECSKKFLEKLFDFDPNKCRLSTYIYINIEGLARNLLNPERETSSLEVSVAHFKCSTEHMMTFDCMAQKREPSPDQSTNEYSLYFKELMNELFSSDTRLHDVIRKYFYENKTLKVVGIEMGFSTERARQMVDSAIEKLRNCPKTQNLIRKGAAFKLDIVYQ